jgi:predicted flap endonuclease-1-like 5' DNA nuclease
MGEVKSMLASSSLMIGLLLGVNAMARPEKDANLLMWAIFFLIAAIGFWYWVSREQRTAEDAAEDAINAAEGVKKRVEIKSADEKPAPSAARSDSTPPSAAQSDSTPPAPSPEPRAAAPTPPPAPASRPEPDAPVPATETAMAASAGSDDLTRIEGIGPKIASILLEAGIDSFAKLAEMSEDAVLATIKAGGLRITPSVNTWAQQAKLAADGDWEGLAQLQQRLRGGKRYGKA